MTQGGRVSLTGEQGGRGDLDLAGRLVGLVGAVGGAEVRGEGLWALGARGAGPIAAVVGVLFLVDGHQLQEEDTRKRKVRKRAESVCACVCVCLPVVVCV